GSENVLPVSAINPLAGITDVDVHAPLVRLRRPYPDLSFARFDGVERVLDEVLDDPFEEILIKRNAQCLGHIDLDPHASPALRYPALHVAGGSENYRSKRHFRQPRHRTDCGEPASYPVQAIDVVADLLERVLP